MAHSEILYVAEVWQQSGRHKARLGALGKDNGQNLVSFLSLYRVKKETVKDIMLRWSMI